MEHVARDQHHFGRELDHLVDGARERLGDVRLALIDAARSQPLILAVAEVQIGEVDEAQSGWGQGPAKRARGVLTSCARGSWLTSPYV
jgi:hypothetical protein